MLLSLFMALAPSVKSRAVRGLAYGPDPGQTVEVHAPIGADGEAPVVVVLVRANESAADGRRIGQIFAARGLVAVVAAIRSSSQNLDSAAAACAWARQRCGTFGGDPRRLFVFGRAEGAGLAVQLALEPNRLAEAGCPPLSGAIGFLGLYGMDRIEAGPDSAPLLLVAGREQGPDAGRLIGALRAAGAPVAEILCPGFDPAPWHRLGRTLRLRLICLDEVERFIRLSSLKP